MGMGSHLNIVMSNERGQVLTPEQMIALQSQQLGGIDRSRPNSPGFAMQGGMQDAAAGKRRGFALQGGVSDVQRESRNDR